MLEKAAITSFLSYIYCTLTPKLLSSHLAKHVYVMEKLGHHFLFMYSDIRKERSGKAHLTSKSPDP